MREIRFGAFVAPHHPLGEHPALLLRRDLALATQLDQLGFNEFWVGEHHSTGWETIGSPEMFLAAAAERTSRIRLGTGVVSLPYHHPFTSLERMIQLDHQSQGRVIFGTGPGALPSDARMFGIDPMVLRNRQDEALDVITRLLRGEVVTHKSEWIDLRGAVLQHRPYQDELELVVASSLSPSGMQLAGKYGMGVLSLASTSQEGLTALPTQWAFAEKAAAEHGKSVDRRNWRVVMTWHLAESEQQAREEAVQGLYRWHNEYNVGALGRPGMQKATDPWELLDRVTKTEFGHRTTTIIGTPDDAINAIRNIYQVTGGFGVVLGFVHDWANVDATKRSWDLFARFVIPEIKDYLVPLRNSYKFAAANRDELIGSHVAAVMAKIHESKEASAALEVTIREVAKEAKSAVFRPGIGIGGGETK